MKRLGRKLLASLTATAMMTGAALADSPKFKADPPSSILTPDKVETSIGTLRFKDKPYVEVLEGC